MRYALGQFWAMLAQAINVISKLVGAADAGADIALEGATGYRDELREERAAKQADKANKLIE